MSNLENANQLLQGRADVLTPATPVYSENNGAFTIVARTGAGDFLLTLDPDFGLTGNLIPEVTLLNQTIKGVAQIGATTATTIQVRINDSEGTPADVAFRILLSKTERG